MESSPQSSEDAVNAQDQTAPSELPAQQEVPKSNATEAESVESAAQLQNGRTPSEFPPEIVAPKRTSENLVETLSESQLERLAELLSLGVHHDFFWILGLLALLFSLGALSLSLMNWVKSSTMFALNIENLSSKELARFPIDVTERILQQETLPRRLSYEDQQIIYSLLRRVLTEHVKTQKKASLFPATDQTFGAQLSSVGEPAPAVRSEFAPHPTTQRKQHIAVQQDRPPQTENAVAPVPIKRPVPQPSREVTAPPVQKLTGADLQHRMLALGKEGMRSRGVKFNWLTFCRNNNVSFFDFSDDGQLEEKIGKVPTSQQWFFALVDDATGHSALFFGPAFIENSDLIQSDATHYAGLLSSIFDVQIKGAKPKLITPPIINVGSGTMVEKGQMTI